MIDSKTSTLSPYFSIPIGSEAPKEVREILQPIKEWEEVLHRVERRIVFFGAFKAGKSSVLNALIGAALLPTRANRATGVITRVGYAAEASAVVIQHTQTGAPRCRSIHFDDIAKYILLDTSNTISKAPDGVDEVGIWLPLSLTRDRCSLVDTPGLMDNEVLTERCYRELARADLAVMVLSADKLLSVHEKEAAQRVHELLNGNVAFIVNRLNLMDEEEKEEIISVARHTLTGIGNTLVGQPRIFMAGAEVLAHRSHNNGKIHKANSDGLEEFGEWLERLFSSRVGEKIAILSRLGVLENHLTRAKEYFEMQLSRFRTEAECLSRREEAAFAEQQVQFTREVKILQLQLAKFTSALDNVGSSFVTDCVGFARKLLETESEWRTKLKNIFDSNLQQYERKVQQLASEVQSNDFTIPIFKLSNTVSKEVAVTGDASAPVGAVIGGVVGTLFTFGLDGGLIGAGAGAWVSKKLFGVNVKKDALEKIEQEARAMLLVLNAEADKFVRKLQEMLEVYSDSQRPRMQVSASYTSARQAVKYYSELTSWSDKFLKAIHDIIASIAREKF